MSIPSKPIGQDPVSQGLWYIMKQLDRLVKVVSTAAPPATTSIPDGADVTQGAKADARSTATDTTPVTQMQVLKEISYMEQNPASRAVTIVNGGDVAQGSTSDDKNASIDTTPATQTGILKYLSYLWQSVWSAANTGRTVNTKVITVQNVDAAGITPSYTSAGETKVMSNAHSYMPATHWSPANGSVTYLGTNSLTCTGWAFTVDSTTCAIRSIGVTTVANVMTLYENGVGGYSIYSSANIIYILKDGIAYAAFAATDLSYKVAIAYEVKAYDQTVDTNKINEQSPLNAQYVEDSILDAVNTAAGTNYYPSSTGMKMDGYKDMTLTGYIIQGDAVTDTITVEVTNDEDTTDATAWVQIFGYSPRLNALVNSVTTGGVAGTYPFALDFDNISFANYRIKVVTGDSTNTITIKMRRKAL